jgi:iron complex outermembrane recepter protein
VDSPDGDDGNNGVIVNRLEAIMSRHLSSRQPFCLLLASLPLGAVAADETTFALDPLVVTGSRVEHSSFDLPAAVDVVEGDRLHADQAQVNVSEALASVPGISVQNRQNYAQDLQISSRGYGARSAFGVRGLRLVADGIPVSMPDGQGQSATFNLDRAERIEVMRGPLSAVYGNHAGGVIQLFTADGHGAPSVETSVSGGSYGTWKIDTAAQGEVNGVGYVVDASRFASEGFRDHSSVMRDQESAKLTFSPDADSTVRIIANRFNQPDTQDPQGVDWATYARDHQAVSSATLAYNTRKSIDLTQGGIAYERHFGDDLLQLSTYLGQRSVVQYQSIPASAQANPKNSGGVIAFDRDYAGFSARWISKRQFAGGIATTTFGVDHERSVDDRRGYENFVGSQLGVKGALRRDEDDRVTSTDPYVQSEWQRGAWTLTAGLRHSHVEFEVDDHYINGSNGDDSGSVAYSKTTPVLAALYQVSPTLNLYVGAARGFETPTLNELFYSGTGGSFSYDLKPATSTHLETGAKAWLGDSSRLDLALFQVRTNDELVVASSTGGRTSYTNAGKTLRQGIEVALDSVWRGGFTSRIAYTGLRAIYDASFTGSAGTVAAGNYMPGIARNSLYGEVVWRDRPSGFHVGFEAVARSKVYVEDSNTQKAAPGYAIANLRFGIDRQYGKWQVSSFLRINNLLDHDYIGSVIVGDSNGRYYEAAPGRNLLLGSTVRYTF